MLRLHSEIDSESARLPPWLPRERGEGLLALALLSRLEHMIWEARARLTCGQVRGARG